MFVDLHYVSVVIWYLIVNIIPRNQRLVARFLLSTRVYLSWQMAALYNCHSAYSARLAISAADQPAPLVFARSRYSRALLLSLNAKNTVLAPGVCSRLCLLGIHHLSQPCWLQKRKKRPHRAGRRHRVKGSGPGSFTLSALRLMTLSDLPQISAIQQM